MARLRRSKDDQSEFFPGFTDIAEIGMGSLATVYRARENGTNRHVALKLLNVRDASARAIESFERESIALGAVSSHPNIVTLYRSFRAADGRPVLVLELCRGSIGQTMVVGGAGLPVAEVVAMGIKIAGALETAHRAEILHRDVKPQNILITEYGEPALADFGVAMLQSSTQTTAGLFDFTTLHAAPELLEGGETSAATDVYELASSMYQLAAGRSAFRAYDGESPASVILRILRDPVQPLANAQIPTQLSDLLLYAMSKDKAQRPPTAAEFAAELATVEAEQGWPRTQFLIRDLNGQSVGLPGVTRLPQLRPRSTPDVAPDVATVHRPAPTWTLAPPAAAPPPPAVAPPPPAAAPPPPAPAAAPPSAPPPAMPPVQPVAAQRPTAPRDALASREPIRIDEEDDADVWSVPRMVTRREPAPSQPPPAQPSPPPRLAPPPSAPQPLPPPQPGPTAFPVPPSAVPDVAGEPAGRTAASAAQVPTWALRPQSAPAPPRAPVPQPPRVLQPPRAPQPIRAPQPVRSPAPQPSAPGFAYSANPAEADTGGLTLDPMSLRSRVTIRSGPRALVVDDHRLLLRSWWRRTELAWDRIDGFELRLDHADSSGTGRIVAITSTGPVELPATRQTNSDLRYVLALLDAYRLRAQMVR